MLKAVIEFSLKNRFLVLIATAALIAAGVYAVRNIPLDAIPDLSDTQVIIYTEWQGRSPDLVEDQITYPITSTLLAAPKVQFVRGFSFLGSYHGFSFQCQYPCAKHLTHFLRDFFRLVCNSRVIDTKNYKHLLESRT